MEQREGEDEKKGQASAEEKMFWASEEKMFWASNNYNTDMSQTDSGAVTIKECELIVPVVNQATVYKLNNTVVVTL